MQIPDLFPFRWLLLSIFVVLAGCASVADVPVSADHTVASLLSRQQAGSTLSTVDARGRFREIFCSVLADHGKDLPEYRPCEEALIRQIDEPPATGLPVDLGVSKQNYLIGFIPGLFWQCMRPWMKEDLTVIRNVAEYGYETRLFEVDGLSSSAHNAAQIRDYILALSPADYKRPLILIGHSKGAVDILQAIVAYPEVMKNLKAVVSIAGAIGGSPLAENLSQSNANMLAHMPGSGCERGDEGSMASLYPQTRTDWLAGNLLPQNIHYYSLIALPDSAHISMGLKFNSNQLDKFDERNDGQLIYSDQFIPGASLLAFANADHWAISTPIARQYAVLQTTLANHSEYPREALFEAILRYVEEDLSQ